MADGGVSVESSRKWGAAAGRQFQYIGWLRQASLVVGARFSVTQDS